MDIVLDEHRPAEILAYLHGQLLFGARGSMVVETAGCWGVVMILTGLYLRLPRGKWRLGGTLYLRLGQKGRLFLRDLHSVIGLWISILTLLLLLSGMPCSSAWGNYLNWARDHWAATQGAPDWPIGGMDASAIAPSSRPVGDSMPGMSAAEMAAMTAPASREQGIRAPKLPGPDLRVLDKRVPPAARLPLLRPVWISPPARGIPDWTISSHVQNRPLRVTYTVNPDNCTVTGRQGFDDLNIVDKVVNIAFATHEGKLFGRLNQAILLLITVSATVTWWRRRPANSLGAPAPSARPVFSVLLTVAIVALVVLLPLFGVSLLLVLVIERLLLRRLPAVRHWLGLPPREA